jgi:hypothetical protein
MIRVVLDNFRIHGSKSVRAWMKEKGNRIRLHFLPPYCPDHNKMIGSGWTFPQTSRRGKHHSHNCDAC